MADYLNLHSFPEGNTKINTESQLVHFYTLLHGVKWNWDIHFLGPRLTLYIVIKLLSGDREYLIIETDTSISFNLLPPCRTCNMSIVYAWNLIQVSIPELSYPNLADIAPYTSLLSSSILLLHSVKILPFPAKWRHNIFD